jgi:uncharacterized membrane protein YhhN
MTMAFLYRKAYRWAASVLRHVRPARVPIAMIVVAVVVLLALWNRQKVRGVMRWS